MNLSITTIKMLIYLLQETMIFGDKQWRYSSYFKAYIASILRLDDDVIFDSVKHNWAERQTNII